jgi:hypothetical protein
MSVRQGSRPYSDMERSRAFSGSDPYERGRYGRDDAAGRFSERQERENRDRGGAGGPGK